MLEFNRNAKRITVSHLRTYEEGPAKTDAPKAALIRWRRRLNAHDGRSQCQRGEEHVRRLGCVDRIEGADIDNPAEEAKEAREEVKEAKETKKAAPKKKAPRRKRQRRRRKLRGEPVKAEEAPDATDAEDDASKEDDKA